MKSKLARTTRGVGKKRESIPIEPADSPGLWVVGLVFLAVVLLAYSPALKGGLLWDDDAHLTKVELRSLAGLGQIWFRPGATQQYYPLVHSAFWLEGKLWGNAVLPYHLVNVLLHALSATVLVAILRRLKIPGALLAGAIFALHPVQVESVAWISELKNTLSGFFFLAAVLNYLPFDRTRERSSYLLALALFALGLIAKSVIATMPAALLVIFWWERGKISWVRDVRPLLPFFALGLGAGLFTAWMEHTYIGAQGAAFDYSLGERVLIAGRVFWFYPGKLFWPAKLTFIYPRWQINVALWWQYLFPLAALALLVFCWWLRRFSRAPLAALLLFSGTLFPVLGFVNVYPFMYSFVADHFQYLASIALTTLVAAGLALLLQRWKLHEQITGKAIMLSLVSLLALLTWWQARMYRDAETLYTTTLERNPDCWLAHNNLSVVLLAKGEIDPAMAHSERALAIKPDDYQPHLSLGDALVRKRRFDEAIVHFQKALELKPDYAETHSYLGGAYLAQHRPREAIAEYEKTLALSPASVYANNNLAWLLATCPEVSLRNGPKSVELASKANRLAGGENANILRTMAAAFAQNGQVARAIDTAEQASRLAKNDLNLSASLQKDMALYRSHLP